MWTHMPFLYPGGIVYAAAPVTSPGAPARWKLHVGRDMDSGQRLPTGLPEEAVECSPTLAWFPDGLALMFVGQLGGDYQFHRMVGPDLARLSPAVPWTIFGRPGAHAGTISPAFTALDRPEVAGIEIAAFGQPAALFPYARFGLDEVARISFEYASAWRMLVSGRSGPEWQTLVYDLKTDGMFRVRLADGRGVYKASIDGDRMAYAERLSEAFEARAIRFANAGEWALEAFMVPDPGIVAETVAPDDTRVRREHCLRANCATGKFCALCRNHPDTRDDLAALGIVDRDGNGCPRGLAWGVPAVALAAIRPDVVPEVWCERFMAGTTPAKCQRCIAVRQSGDADAAARWLQHLAGQRRAFACTARIKTDARRIQECCGRDEKEIAVYRCVTKNREVEPWNCRDCGERVAPTSIEPVGEDAPC